MGDFNINLLEENDTKANCYLNNYFENNFVPCITLPTRITHHSATLIDHIFIKTPKKLLQNKCSSGNLIADIADHLPNFAFLDIKTQSIKNRPYIRLFTPSKINHFNDNLMSENPLINPNELTDSNSSFTTFSTNYLALFDKYFPFVRISRKAFKDKPHITSGIKVSIKMRNKLYKKYLDNPTDVNKAAWKRFRNKTNDTIKKAEALYYRKRLTEHNNSSKTLWNTFGKILNSKKIKHNKMGSINSNGIKQNDPQSISETFNKFFSEIGGKLANKFTNDNSDFKNYLGTPTAESLILSNTSQSEILETIKKLKNTNSTGYDGFSTKFVKLSAPLLAPALEQLFNLTISTGVYPDNLKIAKVIPIFKKGNSTSVNNYRPISILSPINKIFEKILYARLMTYIDRSKLLYKYQFGFRKNHSTEQALIELVDQIRLNTGKNQMTCGIFIDLSKAFDTVNHQILIDKLEHYGIRGIALEVFKSYLRNRKQYVNIDNCKSKTLQMSHGVPQGSVLGPLLFLLFINDLPKCCPNGKVRLFADDTTIFFHSNSVNDISLIGKSIMIQLTAWFNANKLTLNSEKSSFTIFRSSRKTILNLPNKIEFLNQHIERASHNKFLGVILDENLTWNNHINELSSKLKRLFHIFYNIRNYLRKDNITTIYYALIYSRIKYGISVYGQACDSKLKKIQTIQNKLLKVLSSKNYQFSTDMLHNEFDILKIKDIIKQETITFVHKFSSNSLPPVFDDYFETLASNHNRNTRHGSHLLKIINHTTNFSAASMKIQGAKVWNRLDNNLKVITNLKNFRNKFKYSRLPYENTQVL